MSHITTFLTPPEGQRTYNLLRLVFIGQLVLAIVAIWHSPEIDLIGLAVLVGAIAAPVVSGQAWKSVRTTQANTASSTKES